MRISRTAFLIAPKWATSLRDFLGDDAPPDTTGPVLLGDCIPQTREAP